MSRNLLFVLAMGVVLADAATAQTKAEAAQTKTEAAQSKTEAVQTKTEAAPAKTETAQPKSEEAQTQTENGQAQTQEDGKLIAVPGGKALGMSILGNQEAPTSLVIVPWKTSELGGSLGISPMLDDSRLPIDKEVFMRMLSYYEIRSGRPGVGPTTTNATQPSAAAQRRKP